MVVFTSGVPLMMDKSIRDRFWIKVEKTETCWLWKGARNGWGYGYFWLEGKTLRAHRVSYEWANGAISSGLQLDHLCRNRLCVNPDHLEMVTGQVNVLRGDNICAKEARATHCPQDHPYDVLNTYINSKGQRSCRICRLAAVRRNRAKEKK